MHANVLRDIRNLLPQLPDGGVLNFEEPPLTDEQNGQTYPAYRLTRDGFTLLAMGFTGKKALAFKLAYIDAFNRMEAALHQPADSQRMELAFSLAAEAAAQVHRTVFNAVMEGDADEWQHSRYLLNLNYDSQGRPTLPHAQAIASDQMVVSFNSLPQRIADGEIMSATDAQLATLATACTQRLTQRAQHREKQVTLPVYPGQRPSQASALSAKQPPAPDDGLLRMTFR
ncbi:Rha family transcriptional regulator [Comamonas resistens]|uniref:Rha family transcriptional regulator n=1 Tax=Comamonas resistens TaxID=3046670 RepID=A0ABY8T132_9BURK|nr:Rha family transcriptional regulator [Comamonas resistens]MDL5038970.1 Rha family transcriptional regulator [Comamonas resistens]WHS67924.1 Rha family transcriptional regulator [Comamonas resistens]